MVRNCNVRPFEMVVRKWRNMDFHTSVVKGKLVPPLWRAPQKKPVSLKMGITIPLLDINPIPSIQCMVYGI